MSRRARTTLWWLLVGYCTCAAVGFLWPSGWQVNRFWVNVWLFVNRLTDGGARDLRPEGIAAIANALALVLPALLLVLLVPRVPWWAWGLAGIVASSAIETIQLVALPSRGPHIVDAVLNSAGALVGAFLGWLIRRQTGFAEGRSMR